MKLPSETLKTRHFGGSADHQNPNDAISIVTLPPLLRFSTRFLRTTPIFSSRPIYLLALFTFFAAFLSHCDVVRAAPESLTRFVRLYSPWERGTPPASSFEISLEGKGLRIHGEVFVGNVGGTRTVGDALDDGRNDRILFAWSRSPLALDFEGVEIFPDGQFKSFRKASSETKIESSGHLKPRIAVTENANGFQFECEIALPQSNASNAGLSEPIYIAISQIDSSPDGESSHCYCSSIPSTLKHERLHPSSFASLDSFPTEKQDWGKNDTSTRSNSAYSSLRIAERLLRNKWDQYVLQPIHPSLAQKWFEDIASFPDAERFLARTRDGDRLRDNSLDDDGTPKRLTDARSETINHLLGQNWSVHLSRIEDPSECFPLLISTAKSSLGESQNELIAMWLESERLQIAVLQNGDAAFWGSASWPLGNFNNSTKPTSITLNSDGSTNGFGYELYANSESLDMVPHNPSNLGWLPGSPLAVELQREPASSDWTIKTKNVRLRVDFYNTKLTPVEVMSLDPNARLWSWAELTPPQRQSWLAHYVFCVDPEGRYFLESLKHYTSSQAELLRRSWKPAKK